MVWGEGGIVEDRLEQAAAFGRAPGTEGKARRVKEHRPARGDELLEEAEVLRIRCDQHSPHQQVVQLISVARVAGNLLGDLTHDLGVEAREVMGLKR